VEQHHGKRQVEMKNSSDVSKESVLLSRGDSFCDNQEIRGIDILKIDTEGHDLEVIRGFQGMFEKWKILSVIVEVGFLQDQTHGNLQKINNYLTAKGMQLAVFFKPAILKAEKCEFTNALYLLPANT
jgi:hypothetical protein